MAHSPRDIRVTVLLNADEYLAMSSLADEESLAESAFIRHLIACHVREKTLKKLSRLKDEFEMQETTQVMHRQFGVVE